MHLTVFFPKSCKDIYKTEEMESTNSSVELNWITVIEASTSLKTNNQLYCSDSFTTTDIVGPLQAIACVINA